jgi:hypothetical protein
MEVAGIYRECALFAWVLARGPGELVICLSILLRH